eukprot:scaffold11481_cov172-Cylindrotheca_fusiformis.AAC.3
MLFHEVSRPTEESPFRRGPLSATSSGDAILSVGLSMATIRWLYATTLRGFLGCLRLQYGRALCSNEQGKTIPIYGSHQRDLREDCGISLKT